MHLWMQFHLLYWNVIGLWVGIFFCINQYLKLGMYLCIFTYYHFFRARVQKYISILPFLTLAQK